MNKDKEEVIKFLDEWILECKLMIGQSKTIGSQTQEEKWKLRIRMLNDFKQAFIEGRLFKK